MVQATTLNVAFNSHNKSLLTIMMSNNVSLHTPWHQYPAYCDAYYFKPTLTYMSFSLKFVEIKGSVFKKFEKNNLFQMSNSGRFKYAYLYINGKYVHLKLLKLSISFCLLF